MDGANGSGARSYLVEVYQPRTGAGAAVARARSAAEAVSRAGTPVRYIRSIFVPEDETCFHLFESSSREAVVAASERAAFAFARIAEAVSMSKSHPRDAERRRRAPLVERRQKWLKS